MRRKINVVDWWFSRRLQFLLQHFCPFSVVSVCPPAFHSSRLLMTKERKKDPPTVIIISSSSSSFRIYLLCHQTILERGGREGYRGAKLSIRNEVCEQQSAQSRWGLSSIEILLAYYYYHYCTFSLLALLSCKRRRRAFHLVASKLSYAGKGKKRIYTIPSDPYPLLTIPTLSLFHLEKNKEAKVCSALPINLLQSSVIRNQNHPSVIRSPALSIPADLYLEKLFDLLLATICIIGK